MSHESYLVALLQPLGVYDLGENTLNRGELGAWGLGLDGVWDALEETQREMLLTTAESFGLEKVEALFPYRPVTEDTAQRRESLAALLRISGDSFTLAAVNDNLAGCGLNAAVAETEERGVVEVSFPGVPGKPAGFEEMARIIEEIVPCHLQCRYWFWYITWEVLEERIPTWADLEELGFTWAELETYVL